MDPRIFFLLLSFLFLQGTAAAGNVAWSDRVAGYTIAVTLDPDSHGLDGRQHLKWRNASADTVTVLRFHLYLNAFRSERSTFMRGGQGRSLVPGEEGWIDLTSVTASDGRDLTPAIAFIQPDDGNEHDSTVIEIPLWEPLLPGDSIDLSMHFRARLPRVSARTGYAGDFFMVAQWFPKIGVYEGAGLRGRRQGGWNCHQFHRGTEFYADFGVYSVAITVPERFVVGATGMLIAESTAGDSLKTLTFLAEDVHDFAWTASPHFIVVPASWRGVDIRILMQPQRLLQARRYREAAIASLRYLDEHLGVYPYPSLTIVDPPFRALGAGGMEYPTLITAGTVWGMPEGARYPEEVTVHEFTHQYWQGMVASNEVEEAWLDEGLTTYYTARIMDETYGATTSFLDLPGLRSGRGEYDRIGYTRMRNPRSAPVAATTWEVEDPEFGRIIYYKTATMLATLERMIGRSAMDSVMRAYFLRWRFRHPSGEDLVAVFNELVPRLHPNSYADGLGWYFDQVLYDTVTCDYEVAEISSSQTGAPESPAAAAEAGGREPLFSSSVTIRQLGAARIPTSIRIVFEDGSELIEQWDGRASSVVLRYMRPTRMLSAEVDPERIVLLDLNTINNSFTTRPSDIPAWAVAARLALVVQAVIQILAFLA